MTDFIVAIDLGTSHFTGIVGERNADGTFTVVAYDFIDTSSCMKRGNINNYDITAKRIQALVENLEAKLQTKYKGARIARLYVGIGGMSLKTISHSEVKEIEEGAGVTPRDIEQLSEQSQNFDIEPLDLIEMIPSGYYLDGTFELEAGGRPCRELRADYKLVVAHKRVGMGINKGICEQGGFEIAGIIAAPIALADALLSDEEKTLGCAVVNFGAGVTTVTVYKNGILLGMSVVPFGSNIITRDLTQLNITEKTADKLKREVSSAIVYQNDVETLRLPYEGGEREIELSNINAIVEGRAMEIVVNVVAQISEYAEPSSLSCGIIITGGGAALNRLPELLREKSRAKVRESAIRDVFLNNEDALLGQSAYMSAVAVMLRGTEQCLSFPPEEVVEDNEDVMETPITPIDVNNASAANVGKDVTNSGTSTSKGKGEGKDTKRKKGRGLISSVYKAVNKTLFDNEEEN
jgi:cell division protein FtsA